MATLALAVSRVPRASEVLKAVEEKRERMVFQVSRVTWASRETRESSVS